MNKKKSSNLIESEEKIQQLDQRVKELEDQLKRAVADYRNLERRVQEDSLSLAQYLRVQLLAKILPVLDSLDQAVAGAAQAENNSGWLKGVLMSIKQFRQVLSEEGLVEIPAEGSFDPKFHEAVDTAEGEDGKILQIVLRGYTLHGKVIRPAKVIVGRHEGEK